MNPYVKLLRTLLWLQFGIGLIAIAASVVLGSQFPPEIQALNAHIREQGSMMGDVLNLALLAAFLVSFVGLLLVRSWAKSTYLWTVIGTTFTSAFGIPSTVEPAAYGAMGDVVMILTGATLFLLYGTDFGRGWKNLRKQTASYAAA